MSKIFSCVPSFKKFPDFVFGEKLPKLLTDGGDRCITAPSDDIPILSYLCVLSLGKIFVRFVFLLNRGSHFFGNGMPHSASLMIISHSLSPMNIIKPINCDRDMTSNFDTIHIEYNWKTKLWSLILEKQRLDLRPGGCKTLGIGHG